MASVITISIFSLIIFFVYSQYRALQRNITAARASGFKYVVSPVFFQSIPWILLQEALLPILKKVPAERTESWLPLSLFYRIWHFGYEPFEKAGTDTIMIVSPSGNALWTCNPELIIQTCTRYKDFIKPIDMLAMLNIYGPTITASEGEENRVYRKVAAPSFNETTHRTVWTESLDQADMMLEFWEQNGGKVDQLNHDSNRFALHVLSKVFFNREMKWLGQEKIPEGHELTYNAAISSVFKYNDTLFMTPKPILNNSPMESHKKAKQSFLEFQKYMVEMRDETASRLRSSKPSDGGSLLENFVMAGTPDLQNDNLIISPAAVLGNMFIFILAGHETSANTMALAITLLACNPTFQKTLQSDIDSIVGSRPPSEWSYLTDYPKLQNGCVGALMNETLRLYSVLPFIPKTNPAPQTLTLENQTHHLAKDTLILINASAAHRNRKYWPQPPKDKTVPGDASPYPLSSFHPERWLSPANGYSTPAADHFDPIPGSYIPFAEGFRSCMGSRFARVEFCAGIARVFQEYSVELAGGKSDEDFRKAREMLSSGMGFEMGLKMKEAVPLRFVKRVK
ncbi:cytochrome P450 [Zopfia rhizophila CBS 207.26]|uniref:Cytochrome P450 n=1 Tax=Zopfia rhizophila CBS 207.26 TaxID=1314779 RepID=A0A6A6E0C5_9PEZI|nr:cytochrome P450 [Zopfia rhizophila CBS 207.26]